MKKIKDLQAAMGVLQSMAGGNDMSPEQKSEVSKAISAVKRIRREPRPSRKDVARCVREIVDAMHKTFFRYR